jgi:4-hydroxybenzoate polyprenyltransferase
MQRKPIDVGEQEWGSVTPFAEAPPTPIFWSSALRAGQHIKRLRPYLAIARPNYWLRNVFVLPGTAVAAALTGAPLERFAWLLILGLVSACLISSANYTINEWLDAESDQFHPVKRQRPSVVGKISPVFVCVEYVALLGAGLSLARLISPYFLALAATLAVMGFLYNVRPFRTKERVYLDVLSESINNPIRLLMGWFVITTQPMPPFSLILGYWMLGAFLMSIKRYAEFRFMDDPQVAGLYRRSFRFYTEHSLLASAFFYASCTAFLLGAFMVGYRAELALSLPFWALLLAWYFAIGLKPNSPAQHPESLRHEKYLLLYLVLLVCLVKILLTIDIPWLR